MRFLLVISMRSIKIVAVLVQINTARYVLPLAFVSAYEGEVAFPLRRLVRQVSPGESAQRQQYRSLQLVPLPLPSPSRAAHAEVFTSLWEVLL